MADRTNKVCGKSRNDGGCKQNKCRGKARWFYPLKTVGGRKLNGAHGRGNDCIRESHDSGATPVRGNEHGVRCDEQSDDTPAARHQSGKTVWFTDFNQSGRFQILHHHHFDQRNDNNNDLDPSEMRERDARSPPK
uniref:hypothetical protein n=1 Tax=Novipirellula artificiosorum TaxID=2528016 RepID=UPI0011B45A0B|nr:hypothetical protein [Novipirellula artificiosorum]